MPNVKSIINKYNKVVPDPPASASETTCKCTNEEKCPLHQKCLTNNINKATLTSNQDTSTKKYIVASPKPNSNNDTRKILQA